MTKRAFITAEKGRVPDRDDIFKKLFDSGNGDLRVIVATKDDQEVASFTVIGSILASWSDVFAAMLSHEMTESISREVRIQGFSGDGVKAFLASMYTGYLEASAHECVEVAALAAKYAIKSLELLAADMAKGMLAPENACSVFSTAKRSGRYEAIMDAAMAIMVSHARTALLQAHSLDPESLEMVLASPELAITDRELLQILVGLMENTAAGHLDIVSMATCHVHFSAFTQADRVRFGLEAMLENSEHAPKQGVQTSDVFQWLIDKHAAASCEQPFFGYYANVIPSRPSLFNGMSSPPALNKRLPQLEKGDEISWFLPHYHVRLSGGGLLFSPSVRAIGDMELALSADGSLWRTVLDTRKLDADARRPETVFPRRSRDNERWLRLRALGDIPASALLVRLAGTVVDG